MLGLIIWLIICFTWLLYETDWMRVRLLLGGDIAMRLPTGKTLTQEELDYVISVIKPPKRKPNNSELPCWYCDNGHDRRHIDMGVMSYDICQCGASIVILPKRRTKSISPNARLARQIGVRFAPYHQANIAKMKRLIK